MKRKLLLLLAVVAIALMLMLLRPSMNTAQGDTTFDSPLATPSVQPTRTPTLPSPEAQKALQYISKREGIPIEELLIVNDDKRDFPLIDRTFRGVQIMDDRTDHGRDYYLLVDLADGSIEEDWKAIEADEEHTYTAKYGKLHPPLYERLQEADAHDLLPVAIWANSTAKAPTREEVYDQLIAQYPEAASALERDGTPWAVDDPALRDEVRAEYRRLRAEDTAVRIDPLVNYLSECGFEVTTFGAMPSVSTILPKKVILNLSERDDVALIYLIEQRSSEDTDTAIPTDRVPAVWQRGFDGSGIRIAILEGNNIDDGVDCLNIIATREGHLHPNSNPGHMTRVATVAMCTDDTYTGVAPGAQTIDAGFDNRNWPSGSSQEDAVEGLRWSIQDQNADVVNVSTGWETDNNLNWTDRAFDYWAREERVAIARAAGNSGGSIRSPGKAWNVITVGGSDDSQTSAWSDDGTYANSSYINPVGTHREKPEVVAPAVGITTIGLGGDPDIPKHGTSYATPQVAGLAGLLIDRRASLTYWPPAIKAIIMASAVHNVHGPSDIPIGEDLHDGAGSINAILADEIAKHRSFSSSVPCDSPCWWGISISNTTPSVGASLYRHFKASRGERIRVTISWWSDADPPLLHPNLADDELSTNYDLYVYAPSGDRVGYTASNDNNYELVEFVAPETGEYDIRVYRSHYSDNNETQNQLGIAWVRDATYLPDLRNQDSGWTSEFYVLNDSPQPRDVTIHYFDISGGPTPKGSDTCALAPNQSCWIPVSHYGRIPSGSSGSAIVEGSSNVSVIVETRNGSEGYAYTGIPGIPSLAGAGIGTELFVPCYMHNYYNWNSTLYVQNVGAEITDVHAYFYNDSGVQVDYQTDTANANGQSVFSLTGATIGSVRMAAGQPLAAIVHHDHDTMTMAYPGVTDGGTSAYMPTLMKNFYGWTSSYTVQEVTGNSLAASPTYYPGGNGYSLYLNGREQEVVWMGNQSLRDGWMGSAKVSVSGGSGRMAAVVHHANDVQAIGYPAYQDGARDVTAPLVRKGIDGWGASLAVQNVGTTSTQITAYFYDSTGQERGSYGPFTVNPGYSQLLVNELPTGHISVRLHSDGADVVAVVQNTNTDGRSIGYSAVR